MDEFSIGDLVGFRNDTAFGIVQEIDGWKDGRIMISIGADNIEHSNPSKLVPWQQVRLIVKNYTQIGLKHQENMLKTLKELDIVFSAATDIKFGLHTCRGFSALIQAAIKTPPANREEAGGE